VAEVKMIVVLEGNVCEEGREYLLVFNFDCDFLSMLENTAVDLSSKVNNVCDVVLVLEHDNG
jgi:hypothetical protein